ncbi:hypothetical protein [Sphingomonas sp. NFX23]|uniref:hypothetical protein n=1 Tax=Sphingomonas sp. NFX23 TaxID=2819532 RepID=UPI003CF3AA60
MSDLNGTYALVANTPMGNQDMTLTIIVDGSTFTGTSAGAMGSSDVVGSVDGNAIAWKQPITVPMPLTLECKATIDGETISGTVDTGAFGSFPLTGKKTA